MIDVEADDKAFSAFVEKAEKEMLADTADVAPDENDSEAKPKAKAKPKNPVDTTGLSEDEAEFANEFQAKQEEKERKEKRAEQQRARRAKARQQDKDEPDDAEDGQEEDGKVAAKGNSKGKRADSEAGDSDDPEGDEAPLDRKTLRAKFKTDPHETLKQVFGKDAAKSLNVRPEDFVAMRKAKQKLAEREQNIQREAEEISSKLKQRYARVQELEEARKDYESGNYLDAFRKAFGEDVNDFQRRALKQKAGEDPRLAKLERQLKEKEEAERKQLEERRAHEEQQRRQQAQKRIVEDVRNELEDSSDRAIEHALKQEGFVQLVVNEMRQNYDRRTDTTIASDDAARIVLDRMRKIHRGWSRVFDPDLAGDPEVEADRAAPPAKPRRKVSLSQSGAAEAAGSRPSTLSDEERMAKWVKKMALAEYEDRI